MNYLFQYEQAQTRTDLRTSGQGDQKTKRQSKIYFPTILYIIGLVLILRVCLRVRSKTEQIHKSFQIKLEALETCGWVIKPCLGCRYDILKAFHLGITALTSLFCKEAFIGPRGGRNSKPCGFTKQSSIISALSIEFPNTL